MPGWTAINVDDVEQVPWQGTDLVWRPVRHALNARLIGLAAFTAQHAGAPLIERHRESADGRGHEEVYVVLRGRATFTLDGEELDAPAGTLVRVDPQVQREAVAAAHDTAVLALGGDPTFRPSASEWLERARPHLPGGRGKEILEELHAERPGSPGDLIGQALLAASENDAETATKRLQEVLADHPEYRAPLSADPDLKTHLP
jgi:mannose-6-phosphate isomerase-like protein (cupin superfamily)